MTLKPCGKCGSTLLFHDKCTCRVICINCRNKSGMISAYIKQGLSEEQATIASWNDAQIKLKEDT